MEIASVNKIISENEFSKIFKLGDIDLYLSKAYDEDSDKHFLVCSIPEIKELKAQHISYPLLFTNEEQRDDMFINFSIDIAIDFINQLMNEIKENDKKKIEEHQILNISNDNTSQ